MVASLRLAFDVSTDRVMRKEPFISIIRGGDDCDIGCDRVDRGDAHEASCQVGVTFTAGAVPRRRTEFSSSRASGERTGVCSAERLSLPLGAKERPDTADFFDCGKHPLDLPRTAEPERDFRGPALMVNAHVRRSDMFWVRSTSVALMISALSARRGRSWSAARRGGCRSRARWRSILHECSECAQTRPAYAACLIAIRLRVAGSGARYII